MRSDRDQTEYILNNVFPTKAGITLFATGGGIFAHF
jgi:hypothetical protein